MKNGIKPIPKNLKNLYIRGADRLGDAVLTIPALKLLASNYPHSQLYIASTTPFYTLLASDIPNLHPILLPKNLIKEQIKIYKHIKHTKPHLAVLFSGAFKAALLPYLLRIPFRVGLVSDHRTFMLTHPVNIPHHDQHQALTYYQIAQMVVKGEIDAKYPPTYTLSLTVTPQDCKWDFCNYKYIVIAPFASHINKSWPLENFIEVGQQLANLGYKIVVIGTLPEGYKDYPVFPSEWYNLIETTTLREAAIIIANSQFYIGNNSGLTHLAAALDKIVFCISGHSNLKMTAPLGRSITFSVDLPCSPCPDSKMRKCLHLSCLKLISPKLVLETIIKTIS